jgi:hypothetical protein
LERNDHKAILCLAEMNMFYKELKYLAADRLLNVLSKRGMAKFSDSDTPIPYQMNIENAESKMYGIKILRDAALLLKSRGDVDYLNDERNHRHIRLILTEKGIMSRKEHEYLRLFFTTWKTLLLTAIAIASGLIALIKA